MTQNHINDFLTKKIDISQVVPYNSFSIRRHKLIGLVYLPTQNKLLMKHDTYF